jgi:RimJ/RimL family protein N-acetyltransferase
VPELHTDRLWLRPLELADAPAIQGLFPHWQIVRFLAVHVPWPYPPDGAYHFCRDMALPAMASGTQWHWTLRLKANPEDLIGAISLMLDDTNNRGFWLGLPWQGQGLMTEASVAVTDFWFDVLGFPVLRIPKAKSNASSRRISERSGMHVVEVEERDYVAGRMTCEIWEITAEEWRQRPCPGTPPAQPR